MARQDSMVKELNFVTVRQSESGLRRQLLDIASGAVDAARPEIVLGSSFDAESDEFWGVCRRRGYVLVAVGKAAQAMSRTTVGTLGQPVDGLVVSHVPLSISGLETIVGGHPVPNAGSLRAGQALVSLLHRVPEATPVVVLISGGSSALCEVLKPGVDLEDLIEVNRVLLASGLAINKVNVIRQSLSMIKGGGLAQLIGNRPHRGLVISDVVGNNLAAIGSGLLSAPSWRVSDPWDVASAIQGSLSENVVHYLQTAEPFSATSTDVEIIADGGLVARRAHQLGVDLGFKAEVKTTTMEGTVEEAVQSCLAGAGPGLSIFCGETTVEFNDGGLGGRNQHGALLSALAFADPPPGRAGWLESTALFVGTDGRDGPTSAAGALVDCGTVDRVLRGGHNPRAAVRGHDSFHALQIAEDLIVAQPTGTNVGDLWMFARRS